MSRARIGSAVLALITAVMASRARAADSTPGWTRSHALPLSSGATELLIEASARSSIIATQLKDLELSDVVVYLADLPPGTTGAPASHLTFLSKDVNARYVVVRIDRFHLSPLDRIVLLGHELHHALEVAAAPDVKDPDTLAQLYRRIGRETSRNQFESEGARATSVRVKTEILKRDE